MAEISSNWTNLCLTDIRKWFTESKEDFESMISQLYSTDTSDKQEEYDMTYTGIGNFKKFNGVAAKDAMNEEYKKTFDFPEYMDSIDISRKLWDDRRDRTLMNMAADFALAANRTKEAHAAEIFNLAFTAAGVYSGGGTTAGPDAKALCASDHPSKADAAYAGVNLSTTAFSPSAVEADRRAFFNITDGKLNRAYARMDTLLVPRSLEEDAWELINTTGKTNTAENNRNFHEGRYKLAVWDELTDSNNWFSMDSRKMKKYLWWIDRVALENYDKYDEDIQTLTFGAYGRWGLGFSDWRWVVGHSVS